MFKKSLFMATLCLMQSVYAADTIKTIEGLTFRVDGYKQHWLEVEHDKLPDEAAFSKAVDLLKQTKGKAIFVKKKTTPFEEALKAKGFENFFSNDTGTEWILKNGSPITPSYTGVHGGQGVVVHDGKILCVEDKSRRGRLQFPGGGGEVAEFSIDAVIREVKEEVGLDVEVIQLIGLSNLAVTNRQGMGAHEYFYLMRIKDGTSHTIKKDEVEIASSYWVPIEDVVIGKLPMPLNLNNQKIIEGVFGKGKIFHKLTKINPLDKRETDKILTHVYAFPLSSESRLKIKVQ